VSSLDSCTSPVLIEGASISDPPVIGSVLSSDGGAGASNYILEGISQTASSCTADLNAGCDDIFLAGGSNVYFNQVTGGNITLLADSHVLVQNSTFGPCYAGTPATGNCTGNMKIDNGWVNCSGGTSNCSTTDVTFRNNTFQKFLDNLSGGHFECMFLRGGNEVMIDSNHFHICQLHAIFIQPADGSINKTIIQNNWIDETENTVSAAPYYDTSYNASDTNAQGVEFAGDGITGLTVRYNTLSDYTSIIQTSGSVSAGSDDYVYGNIAGQNGACISDVTYDYNIFLSGQATCGAHDTTVASLPLVNQGYGTEDFHLTCSSPAEGFVTPASSAYLLAYDHDLHWRGVAGPRDAGSESEASCGT
jgi:hypothetical protein